MANSLTDNRKRLNGIGIGSIAVCLLFLLGEPSSPGLSKESMFDSPSFTVVAATAGLLGLPLLAFIGCKLSGPQPRRKSLIWRIANVNYIFSAALLGFALASSIYFPNYLSEQSGSLIFFVSGGVGFIAADIVQHSIRGSSEGAET